MSHDSSQAPVDVAIVVLEYGKMLLQLSLMMLGNAYDAEDAVQETFIKYDKKAPHFREEEHKKAWLIKVTSNHCRDLLRRKHRRMEVELTNWQEHSVKEDAAEVLTLVQALPAKYRLVIILHYMEGYKVEEMASIIGISTAAVKKRLQRGREMLRLEYGKEELQ